MRTYRLRTTFDPSHFRVDYRKELNAEQLPVVLEGEGKVLVLAGAGSGKTRTIVYRVAYLLERGVRPDEILLVTFTNKAAQEMLTRIEQLLGTFPRGLWGGTFHHVANLLLRKTASAIGYQSNFTILDEEDSRDLLAICVKEAGIDPKQRRFPSPAVLQDVMSLSRNTSQSLSEAMERKIPNLPRSLPDVERVVSRYEQRKREGQLMDFDDLLTNLLAVLRDERWGARLARKFRYLLVDEYQDTNTLQAEIVDRLSTAHENLLVVGDDSQSIYSFRGAEIRNILTFPERHPGTTTFRLETNYRSTPEILNVANKVIQRNRKQFRKELRAVKTGGVRPALVPAGSAQQEATYIAQRVLELRDEGVPLNEIAVLFRASHHSQALEFELTRRDIPYEFRGGLRFFERAHVKDVLAFLKIIANPRDEVAWHRCLTLQVGIGSVTAGQVFTALLGAQDPVGSFLEPSFLTGFDRRSHDGLRNFRAILERLHAIDPAHPTEMVESVFRGEYRLYLESQYPNAEERIADLEQLARFADRYDDLNRFLAEVSLQESFGVEGLQVSSKEDEQLVLSTIHQAKGLEWQAVFLIGLTAGNLPNPKALAEPGGLEEERRLFYVAVTRAKRELSLSYPLATDPKLMTLRLQEPSPFLEEIPEDSLDVLTLEEDSSHLETTLDVDEA